MFVRVSIPEGHSRPRGGGAQELTYKIMGLMRQKEQEAQGRKRVRIPRCFGSAPREYNLGGL